MAELQSHFFTSVEYKQENKAICAAQKSSIFTCWYSIFLLFAGFIDFIVYPTFSLLTDMAEKIVIPLVEENPGPPDPCNRHRY